MLTFIIDFLFVGGIITGELYLFYTMDILIFCLQAHLFGIRRGCIFSHRHNKFKQANAKERRRMAEGTGPLVDDDEVRIKTKIWCKNLDLF